MRAEKGIRAKLWTTRAGREIGGGALSLGAVATMLSNKVYIGKVTHGDEVYEGQHEAIVDADVFRRVQELLAENRVCGSSLKQNKYGGLLKGLLDRAARAEFCFAHAEDATQRWTLTLDLRHRQAFASGGLWTVSVIETPQNWK